MKKIFKLIGEYALKYILVAGIGLFFIFALWIITVLPEPYPIVVICLGIGVFAGFIIGFNAKK